MIKEAAPYEKELKKKYHIDLSNLDNGTGEALGKLIGEKMLVKCPDQMTKLAKTVMDKPETATKPVGATMTGVVTDVVANQFVVITVKDTKGPEQKFIWLDYFDGSDLLKNPADIKGKTVEVTYTENDFYNPAIKDYMKYKIIAGLVKK
jgi:hypothetical protein